MMYIVESILYGSYYGISNVQHDNYYGYEMTYIAKRIQYDSYYGISNVQHNNYYGYEMIYIVKSIHMVFIVMYLD